MDDYRGWDAVANSDLSNMMRSPAYCQYHMTHPSESTKAQAFGTAAHCIVLEPEEFDKRYTLDFAPSETRIADKGDDMTKAWAGWRNTTEYKDEVRRLKEHGVEVLKQSEFDSLRWMRDNVAKTEIGQQLAKVSDGTELSILVEDEEFGVRRKIRPDMVCMAAGMIVDLKKVRAGGGKPWAFSKACETYGYYRAAAYYLDSYALLPDVAPCEHFVFLTIEEDAPHEVRPYVLDADSVELGRAHYHDLIISYVDYREQGYWPGGHENIEEIRIPEYAFHKELE